MINARIRTSVHPCSSSHPCAQGAALRLPYETLPLRRGSTAPHTSAPSTALAPPSRYVLRHFSTWRSPARSPHAMSLVLSPRANRSAVSSLTCSRAACFPCVSPPPCACLIAPAYRNDHETSDHLPPRRVQPQESVAGNALCSRRPDDTARVPRAKRAWIGCS